MDKLQQTFECQKKTFSTVYKETYNNESFNGLSCAFNYMCTSSHSSLIYSVTVWTSDILLLFCDEIISYLQLVLLVSQTTCRALNSKKRCFL